MCLLLEAAPCSASCFTGIILVLDRVLCLPQKNDLDRTKRTSLTEDLVSCNGQELQTAVAAFSIAYRKSSVKAVLINYDRKTSCGLIWDGLFTIWKFGFDSDPRLHDLKLR